MRSILESNGFQVLVLALSLIIPIIFAQFWMERLRRKEMEKKRAEMGLPPIAEEEETREVNPVFAAPPGLDDAGETMANADEDDAEDDDEDDDDDELNAWFWESE